MSVNRATGYPDYTSDGVNKNIPWIYSRKFLKRFYDVSPIPLMTNSDFSADIKQVGDKVIIPTVPDVTVKDYVKGGNTNMENLSSPAVEFPMNRAKYFYFGIDKVDEKQMLGGFMEQCSQNAGQQMNTAIAEDFLGDVYLYASSENKGATAGRKSAALNLGVSGTPITLTAVNILKYIIACEVAMDEQNRPDDGRFMTIPPIIAGIIQDSDLKVVSVSGDSTSMLRHGRLGKIGKFNILVSNLVKKVTDGANTCYHIPFGHISSICFATQLVSMDYFEKLENTIGRAMRGLNVYDWKVVDPKSLGVLYATYDFGL